MSFATKLGNLIINIHLKDYKIYKSQEGFRLVRCPLGTGVVDFKSILPFLAKNSPDAKMVIELGALEARNIAWLGPDFWSYISPRTEQEQGAFNDVLDKNIIEDDGFWRTPWEKEASSEEISTYEIKQLAKSLEYLKNL